MILLGDTTPYRPGVRVVDVSGVPVGARDIVIAAGPCAVESEGQLLESARAVKAAGASILRGGAFKPRTTPDSFQGLGAEGIRLLKLASLRYKIPIVTEIMDIASASKFGKDIDLIQVGARNSQNFSLLKHLAVQGRPVLLKNGMANTVDEWIGASRYLTDGGNNDVILCYRGVRSFETRTRFSMDVGAIAAVCNSSSMPVAADPSHAAGKRRYVAPLALASIAAGADMLEIEVHPDPDAALSDRDQQLSFDEFSDLMEKLERLAEAMGRGIYRL